MKKKLLVPLFLAGMAIPAIASQSEIKGVDAAFIGEYGERAAYIAHASKINAQLAEEGFTLLKNDGTFPIEKGSKITVVGKSSTNIVRGGGGSGAINGISNGVTAYDIQSSLTEAGFVINNVATEFYKSSSKSGSGRTNGNDGWKGNSEVTIGETPIEKVTGDTELMASFDEYNDLAIQVISREGSEGCDILTIDATDNTKFGASNKHALELSDNEQALFDELHDHFDKILIVVNSSNIFECEQFQNDDQVAGIIWIGNPGDVGPVALGRILCGDVNPSGHTVDTWTRDFTKDPTFQNFSDNRHNTGVVIPNHQGRQNHQSADTMLNADGTPMRSYGTDKSYSNTANPTYLEDAQYKVMKGGINGVKPAAYVSYEEGIYLDYRYYETRYADMAKENKTDADEWYNSNEGVLYPFGYGLSYTTFSQ
nr:glycoside hydrolase family 3 C-terminal domain-containing protein [Bacilli bacterium]